jgi:hypothetical protein
MIEGKPRVRAKRMARRRLLHHPAGYMRQCPVGLLHDENVHAMKAMRANDGDRLATARMKWIEDPILRSLIPGIMSLSRPEPEKRTRPWGWH